MTSRVAPVPRAGTPTPQLRGLMVSARAGAGSAAPGHTPRRGGGRGGRRRRGPGRGPVPRAARPGQDAARRREGAEKAAEDKDAKLKAALAKAADLEKALEERDRAVKRERRGTLLEAQHLEESFSSKCFFLSFAESGSGLSSLLFFF